jgi:hypothetical protein
MKTKILYLIAIILVSFTTAKAQQNDPVQQSTAVPVAAPALKLGSFETDYNYSPFKVNGKDMNIQQVNASLSVPLFKRLKDGKLDFFFAGLGYSGLFLSGAGSEFGGTQFHAISVPLTFQKSFTPKYALIVSFVPTLSSDLKDVSGEDILYSGVAMLRVRSSATFSYSIGAAFSKQFFGTVLIPVVGIDWKISDKWSLSGTIPVSEKLKYQMSAKSSIGLNNDFGIGGGSYRLSKKMNSDYFQVQQFKTMMFYNYMLAKNFSVEVSAGYNFTQRLDLYDKDQKVNWVPFNDLNKRVPLAEIRKTGVAIQTGINYRF